MRLPNFEYFEPTSLEEAVSLLSRYKGKAKVLAGGTDLLVRMTQRTAGSSCLINIKRIPDLDYIAGSNGQGISIGAVTMLHALETSTVVRERFPILAQAAGKVASPQVRSMGTIAGNICLETRCWYYNQSSYWRQARPACFKAGGDRCHVVKGGDACHSLFLADTVPALIALGARIKITSLSGDRTIDLEQLYTGLGATPVSLGIDEIIVEVQLPNQPPHTGGVYLKHSQREAINFAIVSVAAVITLDSKKQTCSGARIALGGTSCAPVRAVKAEKVIRGKEIDDRLIEEAAETAVKNAGPIVPIETPVAYRREMFKVFTRRAIRDAVKAARSS